MGEVRPPDRGVPRSVKDGCAPACPTRWIRRGRQARTRHVVETRAVKGLRRPQGRAVPARDAIGLPDTSFACAVRLHNPNRLLVLRSRRRSVAYHAAKPGYFTPVGRWTPAPSRISSSPRRASGSTRRTVRAASALYLNGASFASIGGAIYSRQAIVSRIASRAAWLAAVVRPQRARRRPWVLDAARTASMILRRRPGGARVRSMPTRRAKAGGGPERARVLAGLRGAAPEQERGHVRSSRPTTGPRDVVAFGAA
jgi:hypothetical protein